VVVHLGAQAGVRYSAHQPQCLCGQHIVGFLTIWKGAVTTRCSTSSCLFKLRLRRQYRMPFSVHHNVDHPSPFTPPPRRQRTDGHSYASLYGLPITGLRVFLPSMGPGAARHGLFLLYQSDPGGPAIDVFNDGRMQRDFTYIDDVVEGVVGVMERIPVPGYRLERRRARSGDELCSLPDLQ